MVGSDVESEWYQALFEEDCLWVMRLLKDHPSLWKQGWKGEPSRMVGSSRLNSIEKMRYPKWSPWKGRTALHVGARRGCGELLNQVLDLCKEEEKTTPSSKRGEISGRHSERAEAAEGGGHTKKEVDREDANLGRARSVGDSKPFGDGSNEYPQESAGISEYVSLLDLLLAKDGEYQLDAITMATLNGNSEIVRILFEARCPYSDIDDGYDMARSALAELQTKRAKMEKPKTELREVTKKVIARFSVDPIFLDILDEYTIDRDFNFLPQEEYLFHFLISCHLSGTPEVVRGHAKEVRCIVLAILGYEVFRSSTTLWRFLWEELQDGQGRLPLHVAVDCYKISAVFGSVFAHCMPGDDDEMIRTITQAVDGGGRTAVHRAIMCPTPWFPSCHDLPYRYPSYEDLFNFLGLPGHFMGFHLAHNLLDPLYVKALEEWDGNIANSKNNNSLEIVTAAFIESFTIRQHRQYSTMHYMLIILNNVSEHNGFGDSRNDLGEYPMPIHNIIIKRDLKCFESLLRCYKKLELNMTLKSSFEDLLGTTEKTAFHWHHQMFENKIPNAFIKIDSLLLAILVGEESMVRRILALEKNCQVPIFLNSCARAQTRERENQILSSKGISIHPLHLAAMIGQYGILKLCTDHERCDPFVEDYGGNNALHHALYHAFHHATSIGIKTHLFKDYVNCEQIRYLRHDSKDLKDIERLEESLIARKGCINLLIQLGCNILHSNNSSQVPYPGNEMNAKLREWWHEKQEKEFANIQNTLSVATNAISVTATLVATTSYVGPLQPPLGYDEVFNRLQLNNIWVKIFIICDTLSFYLAIAAIISSLIPSLPMPQQSMMEELQSSRRMVIVATSFLSPSIIFVLVAFASGSFAVAKPRIGLWNNGDLTIVTACVGGFFCLVTIVLFFIRVARIVFGKYAWMRKLYKVISF